jgi:hypothetical protein
MGRPMPEKPQFEHKNPRFFAVCQGLRPGYGISRGAHGDLRRNRTGLDRGLLPRLERGGAGKDGFSRESKAQLGRGTAAASGAMRMDFG